MMTSALLGMLDTPEEVATDFYGEDYEQTNTGYSLRPQQQVDSTTLEQFGLSPLRAPGQTQAAYQLPSEEVDPAMFERLSLQSSLHTGDPGTRTRHDETGASWSPTWQGPSSEQEPEDSTLNMAMMPPRQTAPDSSRDSDVGLYLP
jgi:hypothetical protein